MSKSGSIIPIYANLLLINWGGMKASFAPRYADIHASILTRIEETKGGISQSLKNSRTQEEEEEAHDEHNPLSGE